MDPESISTVAGLPVNTIPIIVTLAATAFHVVRESNKANLQQKSSAEEALISAYNLTLGYYASLKSGTAKDTTKEHQVAEAWDVASIRLRPFDKTLSQRLSLKSRFWREGAAWSTEQIAMANIKLEDIRREGAIVLAQ
ncbi:MAG: hypothetical protein JAY74_10495 [Candidatus Thiodiazotropha taylori]|nr:hypothetical protein [Candidatus Thiodiazotropha taylori]